MNSMLKEKYRPLIYIGGGILAVLIFFAMCCTVVDSGEVGIRFHKWSLNEQDYGGVEGTCKGWVFYNPITTNVFTYPTFTQRKQYETFSVNAKDASLFEMDPTIAYRINYKVSRGREGLGRRLHPHLYLRGLPHLRQPIHLRLADVEPSQFRARRAQSSGEVADG